MYLTDIISESYKNWQMYSQILIHAPTGLGKTNFIINSLLPYAVETGREILYVSNRTMLQQQIIADVCEIYGIPYENIDAKGKHEFRGITFITYQTLQELLKNRLYKLPYYYYLIFDEVHYLVEDSNFNPSIKRLYDWMSTIEYGNFIAISATMEDVFPYLGKFNKEWRLLYEDDNCEVSIRPAKNLFGSLNGISEYLYYYHVESQKIPYKLIAYTDIADVVDRINTDETDEKWLVFQSSKNAARTNIEKELKCSNSLISAEDKESLTMQALIQNCKFDQKVLIATKVLDNGISIHDDKLVNIVIDTTSKTEFIQMLGRKRKAYGNNSEITLYLPKKSKSYFCWILYKQIMPALNLLSMTREQMLEQMLESEESRKILKRFCYFEQGQLVVNQIGLDNLQNQKKFVEKMISDFDFDTNAFLREQFSWLGYEKSPGDLIDLDIEKRERCILEVEFLLDGICDKFLTKQEQKDIRKNLGSLLACIFPERFKHEERMIGKHLIEECLRDLRSKYELFVINGKRKGESTQWIFKKHLK